MRNELSQWTPKPLSPEETRASVALGGMLDTLEETAQWIAELDRERIGAMKKRAHLKQAIAPMLRASSYEVSRRHRDRYARLSADGPARTRTLSGPIAKVMGFLSEFEFTTVRAAEIMHYLRLIRLEVNPKYASKALYDLEKAGIVSRKGHGTFTVNHSHPDLVAIRLERVAQPGR